MANYKPDNIGQREFLTVDYLEIIGSNTFEYSLYRLLEREDMVSGFIAKYKNEHNGRVLAGHPSQNFDEYKWIPHSRES